MCTIVMSTAMSLTPVPQTHGNGQIREWQGCWQYLQKVSLTASSCWWLQPETTPLHRPWPQPAPLPPCWTVYNKHTEFPGSWWVSISVHIPPNPNFSACLPVWLSSFPGYPRSGPKFADHSIVVFQHDTKDVGIRWWKFSPPIMWIPGCLYHWAISSTLTYFLIEIDLSTVCPLVLVPTNQSCIIILI